ncbi:MAG: glycine zipper 2TM domain-containing protein [Pseudobdellovibrionaceae bacterium]
MMKRKYAVGIAAGVTALLLTTGVAFAVMSGKLPLSDNDNQAQKAAYIQPASGSAVMTDRVVPDPDAQRAQQVAPQPSCDDGNIVGTVAGGVAGGVVGSQFGKGNGKTATTIGGALGGAVLGNQFIPTRNVTCR